MAVTAFVFGKLFNSLANKEADLNSDTIKMALFTSAHAPDQDADQYYDAAHGMTEVSNTGTNYSTGGATLTNPAFSYTAGTNVFAFTSDAASWASSTITARYACIYDATPASNKPFISYLDFGADVTSTNGTFTVTPAAGGWFTVTVS